MTDRAQDTEAIRAILDYCAQNANDEAMADAASEADAALDRLVARLEAAERREKVLRRGLHDVMTAEPVERSERLLIGACHWSPCAWCDARAALAAAAPGETTLAEPVRGECKPPPTGGEECIPDALRDDDAPGSASAVQTKRCLRLCLLPSGHSGDCDFGGAAPGETEQTP